MKTAGERLGPIETQTVVKEGIDKNGHLNNVWWGVGLEKGRLEAATTLGVGLHAPLQRICINYDAQIFRGDRIVIATFATNEEDSVIFNQSIQRKDAPIGSSLSVYANYPSAPEKSLYQPLSNMSLRLGKVFPLEGPTLHHLTAPYCFEKGREHFLTQSGIDMDKLREEQGLRFVVAILDAKYFQPMSEGQYVEITTGLEIDDSLFFFQQEMIDNNRVISRAEITCAIIDNNDCLVTEPEVINPIAEQLLSY